MDNKKMLQQLLIASEYLRLLLEDDKNYGFDIDGRIVTAASLRNDIEDTVGEYYPVLTCKDKAK